MHLIEFLGMKVCVSISECHQNPKLINRSNGNV